MEKPKLRSPTKFRVLAIIGGGSSIESHDLASRMRISVPHASKLLRSYWERGLLRREERPLDQGGTKYAYFLTRHGAERLAYFQKIH